jgi:membrane associated rhomboid family serine protease
MAYGKPYVTYGLIAANVLAYLYGIAVLGENRWILEWSLVPNPGVYLDFVAGGGDEWYRWISSGFLHFGFLHLGMNMYVLFQFGSQLEPLMGRLRFLALYFLAMVGGSASVMLLASSGVHGGASGAIFGLLAAYGVVLAKLKLDYRSLVATAGLWLVLGFVVPGISWEGHLGGAIAGALVMLAMLKWVERPAAIRRRE